MRTVFADTGYWIALWNPYDALHRKTTAFTAQLGLSRIVTTEMVLVEYLASASSGGESARENAANAVKRLKADPKIEVVPQTSEQFDAALALYDSRLDKDWSLTDCASFVLMEQMDIREALAHDHNFEQAGFIALLSDESG